MNDDHLVRPMKLRELADMLGWTKRRVGRHLEKIEKTTGAKCMVKVGGQWVTTLQALREVWPRLGERLVDGSAVMPIVTRHESELAALASAVLALDARIRTLESGKFRIQQESAETKRLTG